MHVQLGSSKLQLLLYQDDCNCNRFSYMQMQLQFVLPTVTVSKLQMSTW